VYVRREDVPSHARTPEDDPFLAWTKRRVEAPAGAAEALERDGEAIAQAFVDAVKRGDWQAGAFLFERMYGKPRENVTVELRETVEDGDRLSSAELEQLRRRVLQAYPHLRVLGAPSVLPDTEVA
jgi:hypothetical protein